MNGYAKGNSLRVGSRCKMVSDYRGVNRKNDLIRGKLRHEVRGAKIFFDDLLNYCTWVFIYVGTME